MITSTPCILFAGGKSSRMGTDKALLPFASFTTLTEFQYTRLKKIFQNVYISCKNSDKFDFEADFIEDSVQTDVFAPTAGFIATFSALQTEKIFVLSVDTPFINADIIKKILEADTENSDAVVAKTEEGMQPLCGLYHASLVDSFEKMQANNNHKLGYLLKNSRTTFVFFEAHEAFLNLNHPHEYKKALTLV